MKPLLFALCFVFACGGLSARQTPTWQPSPGHTQVPIWPGTPPDAQPVAEPEESHWWPAGPAGPPGGFTVYHVTQPTMTVYSPTGNNTGVAVVVFPGGGYEDLAIDLEGTEVCDWLTPKWITCVLLKYRVPGEEYYPKSAPYPKSGPIRNHLWRSKMRRGHCGWRAFTPPSGISIRTRLECSGFRQAGICRQR